MTTSTPVASPQHEAVLPEDPNQFFRFAAPIVRAILGRSGGSLRADPSGQALVAAELPGGDANVEEFLHRAVEAKLLQIDGRWYHANRRLPTESPQEIRARCQQVVIEPEPAPSQHDSGYAKRRGGNRRRAQRSR